MNQPVKGTVNFCLDARTATNRFPGIGRYVSNLTRAMVGHLTEDENLLLLCDSIRPTRWHLPDPIPGRVVRKNMDASLFGLRQQWEIPRQLLRLNVHVYHSPYYLMPYRPGPPTVVTIYDMIPQIYPQYVSRQARLLFRLTTKVALKAAAHVITISKSTARDLQASYRLGSKPVTTIPLAPAPQFRQQSQVEVTRVVAKYGVPSSYILYIGSDKPHKNLNRLIDAYNILSGKTTAPPQLLIAGVSEPDNPVEKSNVATSGYSDGVRFLGPIEEKDLPGLYTGAKLFVFPSIYEGFGLPVIEAMACGTPVACSNTSSLSEVAGKAAIYFDPTRTDDIESVVLRLLDDKVLRVKLRQEGLARARRFSWSQTAQATLEIYRLLARS